MHNIRTPIHTMRILLCLLAVLLAVPPETSAQKQAGAPERLADGSLLLDDFESDPVGGLPVGWFDRDGNRELVNYDSNVQEEYKYRIMEEEGNRFLRYEGMHAKHINYPLANKEMVNIHETPVLSWRVRAHELPDNADEDVSDRNDSVVSVYVVFEFGHVLFRKVPKSIRYSWSTTRETGSQFSKLFGNQKILVIESGEARTGEWVTFERNIYEDYRELFGETPPKQPLAILVLSDGDSTGSHVMADYDDFILKPVGN
ncbi:MAG: DUF3047 domain-containing protein [Balneolaceae bacterium]|nr:DUF3047 domain-containing protein [Balneolaceae bacterium]